MRRTHLHPQQRLWRVGQERGRGRALVAPALESWVATKLAEDAAVLKERRKAREERALAAVVHYGAGEGGGAVNVHGQAEPAAPRRRGGRGRGQ